MVGLRLQQGIGWECPDHWDIWTTHLNISLFNFCFWIVYQVQIFWLYYYKINVLVSMFTRLFPHRRKHQGPSRCSWSCPQWPERKKIREGSIWNIFSDNLMTFLYRGDLLAFDADVSFNIVLQSFQLGDHCSYIWELCKIFQWIWNTMTASALCW